MSAKKGKLAIYWAASCGGCEIAILAINEKILDVAAAFDVVFWPCATDGKVRDVEKMADGEIDLCLFNGSIRTSEQEYMAQLMRRKSKVLVAFGSCAHEGCIPGLANVNSRKSIFDEVYKQQFSTENPNGTYPQHEVKVPEGSLHLPIFYDSVRTLDQTVEVDYYLPGCPPTPELFVAALEDPGGIKSNRIVCLECRRKKDKSQRPEHLVGFQLGKVAPELCLINQGFLCVGSSTRNGCGAPCPRAGHPCVGCRGPSDNFIEKESSAWLESIQNVFATMTDIPSEEVKAGLLSPQMAMFLFQFSDYATSQRPPRPKEKVL